MRNYIADDYAGIAEALKRLRDNTTTDRSVESLLALVREPDDIQVYTTSKIYHWGRPTYIGLGLLSYPVGLSTRNDIPVVLSYDGIHVADLDEMFRMFGDSLFTTKYSMTKRS